MVEVKLTKVDRDRVALAESMFAARAIDPVNVDQSSTRMAQHELLDARAGFSDQVACIILGIVEESNSMLPIAIESGNQVGIESALGGILTDACLICSNLRFDFATIVDNFDSKNLQTPDGDALIALYKNVGILASVAMRVELDVEITEASLVDYKVQFGYAIFKLCSAVHWLALSNDMDVATLFNQSIEQAIAAQKLAASEKPPENLTLS